MIEKKNYEDFLHTVGISDDEIFNYTLKKLQRQELPPAEREALDQSAEIRRQNALLQQQLTEVKSQKPDSSSNKSRLGT